MFMWLWLNVWLQSFWIGNFFSKLIKHREIRGFLFSFTYIIFSQEQCFGFLFYIDFFHKKNIFLVHAILNAIWSELKPGSIMPSLSAIHLAVLLWAGNWTEVPISESCWEIPNGNGVYIFTQSTEVKRSR